MRGTLLKTTALAPKATVTGFAGSFWGIIPIPQRKRSRVLLRSVTSLAMKGRLAEVSWTPATFPSPKSAW